MSPKIVDKEEKAQQILIAAIEVISGKGYHQTTIQDIAHQAGMGKGTLYQYFPSKETIFLGIIDVFFSKYLEIFNYIQQLSIPDGFRFMLETLFTMTEKEEKNISLMMQIYGHSSKEVNTLFYQQIRSYYQDFITLFGEFIQRGQREGEISTEFAADILARNILSTLDGLMLQIMLFNKEIKPRQKELTDMFLKQWLKA